MPSRAANLAGRVERPAQAGGVRPDNCVQAAPAAARPARGVNVEQHGVPKKATADLTRADHHVFPGRFQRGVVQDAHQKRGDRTVRLRFKCRCCWRTPPEPSRKETPGSSTHASRALRPRRYARASSVSMCADVSLVAAVPTILMTITTIVSASRAADRLARTAPPDPIQNPIATAQASTVVADSAERASPSRRHPVIKEAIDAASGARIVRAANSGHQLRNSRKESQVIAENAAQPAGQIRRSR